MRLVPGTLSLCSMVAIAAAQGCAVTPPAYPSAVRSNPMSFAPFGRLPGALVAPATGIKAATAPQASGNQAPVVSALEVTPDDSQPGGLRLKLSAQDPEGRPLTLSWAATTGRLSAQSGETVSWQPHETDGNWEIGPASISVLISDGLATTPATARLTIDAKGLVKVLTADAFLPEPGALTPQAVMAGSAASTALIAPTTSEAPPTEAALDEVEPPIEAAKPALFLDGFEDGLAQWQINAMSGEAATKSITWEALAQGGPEDAGTLALAAPQTAQGSFQLRTLAPIDLSQAQNPRLRVAVKNGQTGTVSFKAIWESASTAYPEEVMIGTRFTGERDDWTVKEFDLSALKHRPGRLVLIARAIGGGAPRIDHVSVVDAE